MKKILTLALSFLSLLVLYQARPAFAEDTNHRLCRLALEEVRKTQAIMERAAPVIRACENDSAKMLFGRALRSQAEARATLRNHRCLAALHYTARARRLTFAALKLCGDNSGDSAAPVPYDTVERLKD